MPGRKSSSGSERKPSGSKPDPKASSSKPDPMSGSQPKGSPDKKGKGPMPKSTQDEPSKENRASRDGEPSTDTQPTASKGNTTQAGSGRSVQLNRYVGAPPSADQWTQYSSESGPNHEGVTPGGSISGHRQSLDDEDFVDDEGEEKEEPENSGKS